MRIRELVFNNVRAFRGEQRISFVDPLTDAVQPVTVIAGTNGTGKTTFLETVYSLLNPGWTDNGIIDEITQSGFACLELEFTAQDLLEENESAPSHVLHLMAGSKELAPAYIETQWPDAIHRVPGYDKPATEPARKLEQLWMRAVAMMGKGARNLHGGLIYFPQNRHLFSPSVTAKGIQPPPPNRDWLARIVPSEQWEGTLESFFVWQNYLDLEAGAHKIAPNRLKNFVQEVEAVLGNDRPITIREGRVYIPTIWSHNGGERATVRLDQLPSGEQQCLWMLGELARRRRDGGVILIDEPETSLHPTLQRLLVHQFREVARRWDCQLILATHSLEVLRAVHESQRINLDHLDAQPATDEVLAEVAA